MVKTQQKKKLTALFLLISMLCALIVPVGAEAAPEEEEMVCFSVNEYDMILNASRAGKTAEGVSVCSSYDVESVVREELLYRRTLSDEELCERYGYSNAEIEIIRAYEGGALEDTPELRGLFSANFTGKIYKVEASQNALAVRFEWMWDDAPAITLFSEIVAMRWGGTNPDGGPMNLVLDSATSYARVDYWLNTNQLHEYRRSAFPTFENIVPYEHAQIKYASIYNPGYLFPNAGQILLRVVRPDGVTTPIKEAQFVFSYGHGTVSNPAISVGFPAMGGISFSVGTAQMWHGGVRLGSNGAWTEYAP